jgi:hypothetical protein
MVEGSNVVLDVDLPVAAMLFKGAIKKRVRAELGALLD